MSNISNCGECSFYEDSVQKEGTMGNLGLCRINPPVRQPDVKGSGLWPMVSASDWCGHFDGERLLSLRSPR
jgi:hypothetical protein